MKIITAIQILLFCVSVYSNPLPKIEPFIDSAFKQIISSCISIDFEIKTKNTFNEVVSTVDGNLKYSKKQGYKLDLGQSVTISDNKTMWKFSRNNNQVIIDNTNDIIGNYQKTLENIINNFNDKKIVYDKNYRCYKICLNQPKTDFGYKELNLWIDNKTFFLKKAKLINSSGITVIVNVLSIKKKKSFPNSMFKFVNKNNAEVFDCRK